MACPITDKSQRKYPLKQPDNWKPKVPRWTLRLPEHVSELVIAYVGVQEQSHHLGISKDNYSHINSSKDDKSRRTSAHSDAFGQATAAIEEWTQKTDSKPLIVNRLQVLAGRDIPTSQVWACYWISKSHADTSLALLNLKKIYTGSDSSSTSVGLWLEVINPDLTRFETNYSGTDYRPGLAELHDATLEPHELTGYWGAARDRIRASAYDNFQDGDGHESQSSNGQQWTSQNGDSATSATTDTEAPSHLKGTNKQTIAHIRSGQFWANCPPEECSAYETSLEPHLLTGLADIFSRPTELGDYGLRFLRNLPSLTTKDNHHHDNSSSQTSNGDKQKRKETCAAGFSRSLTHLESWAKDCPSHHEIYGGAIRHKLKFKQAAKMRTWHEVAVLKPGEARWEYCGCVPGTGTMGFQ